MTTQYQVNGNGVVVATEHIAPPRSTYVSTPARVAATERLVARKAKENEERKRALRVQIDAAMAKAGPNRKREHRQIRAGDLFVDVENYQRALDEDEVLEIACNYSEHEFGDLLVNERADGTLAVIDGQHRLRAMIDLLWGADAMLWCYVLHLATIEEESDLFVKININRRALAYVTRFRGELRAKRPDAVEIADAVAQYGLTVRTSTRGGQTRREDGEITAIKTLQTIRGQGGIFAVHCILTTLRQAFGTDPDGYRIAMLEGLWHFLLRFHPAYSHQRLLNVLVAAKPVGVYRQASLQQGQPEAVVTAKHSGQVVGLAIHGLYQGTRRSAQYELPPFQMDSRKFGPTMTGYLRRWRSDFGIDPKTLERPDAKGIARQSTFLRTITTAHPIPGIVLDPGRNPVPATTGE